MARREPTGTAVEGTAAVVGLGSVGGAARVSLILAALMFVLRAPG